MKLLVTGARGQLGSEVVAQAAARGYEVIGADIGEMDITDADSVDRFIENCRPDAVVHCAAWTQVDAAEDPENREIVRSVNVLGTEHIARACEKYGSKLIHLSTEYVFNGQGERPWHPDDAPEPLNFYGLTKFEAEQAARKYAPKHFIVRISWLFGKNGKNFVRTMLALGKTHEKISVVSDQVGSPTYAPDLARLLLDMAESEKFGIYHASNEGFCSWYEFAKEIFRQAGDPAYAQVKVLPVTSAEYPAKAKRPFNSRMDKSKLDEAGFERLPSWRDALGRYLNEIEV